MILPTSYFMYQQTKKVIATDYNAQLKAIEYSLSNLFKEVSSDLDVLSHEPTVRNRNDAAFTSFLNVNNSKNYKYHITPGEQAIIDIFANYKNTHLYINSIYMGRENGSFVRSHPRNEPTQYDPRNRPWYKTAKSNPGKIVRTEPYASVTINDINIGTATTMIDENNKVYGVIGMDVTLMNITDFIQKTELSYNGSLEIIDQDGIILASKDTNRLNIKEDAVFIEKINQNKNGNFFVWNNELIINFKSPYLNWCMIGHIPINAIYNEIFKVILYIIAIAVGFYTLICIGAYLYFHREIITPIVKLKQAVEKVEESGKLSLLADKKRKDELGILTSSFNQMVGTLNSNAERLIHLKEVAESSNNAKSIFLDNMCHEIRNPLHAMLGMTEMIENTGMSENQKKYVNVLKKSILSLTRIINDILEYTKIEAEMVDIEIKPFNVKNMLSEVVELYNISARQKGLTITMNIEKVVPTTVYGDEVRIRQVLSNLVGNAVKFTLLGSICAEITLDYREKNMVRLLFAVKDTGIGIPNDKQTLLFKRFVQIDSTYTKKFQGTGLGLSICKKLIDLMGGHIWFESEEGMGSTFYFHLLMKTDEIETPLNASTATEIADDIDTVEKIETCKDVDTCENIYTNEGVNAETNNDVDTNEGVDVEACEYNETNDVATLKCRKRVLIVEDDDTNRFILMKLLKIKGFDTSCAINGEEALKVFDKEKFDIILMDIQMPILNGIETTKAIRKLEKQREGSHVPIIGVTGYAYKKEQQEFIAAGMDDCVSKPVDIDMLVHKMNNYLK